MQQLLEIFEKLTDAEQRELIDFAKSLLVRSARVSSDRQPILSGHSISFVGWAGCLSHVHSEKSDAMFNEMILDEWVRGAT